MSTLISASALHCGDIIAMVTLDGRATFSAKVRHITTEPRGRRIAALEVPGRPGETFPVPYQDAELVERIREARWAA